VLEIAGVWRWPDATEEDREAVRRALVAYTSAVNAGASYQELNERHLAIHLSLVGLTGSPRLVAMAESLNAELKLALAQIDRVRRNAHDQAGSHTHLVRLLERGDVAGAAADIEEHLARAEVDIVEALTRTQAGGPPG
jgi:DNA-binding GntR family transcriptional regulator